MSRTNKRSALTNRKQIDPLDFTVLNETSVPTDDTEIIVRNSQGTGSKVSLGVVLKPLSDRTEALETETTRLETAKADKCFAIAMSIAL
jgi:hypothetical protein